MPSGDPATGRGASRDTLRGAAPGVRLGAGGGVGVGGSDTASAAGITTATFGPASPRGARSARSGPSSSRRYLSSGSIRRSFERAHLDLVPVREALHRHDDSVHEDAVLRPLVAQHHPVPGPRERRVLARQLLVGEGQVAVRVASDEVGPVAIEELAGD